MSQLFSMVGFEMKMSDDTSARSIKVVLLCGQSVSSRMMFHGLSECAEISVIRERAVPNVEKLRRRMKKLGVVSTVGQSLFILLSKALRIVHGKRFDTLKSELGLVDDPIPRGVVTDVESINCSSVVEKIAAVKPDLVVVNGTRIISSKVLNAINVPVVNTHMGITPRYRGVHGGYWAVAEGDLDHFGVTVHKVDAGIDTGGVLYQATIKPSKDDTFITYPLLQMSAAIPLVQRVIGDVSAGTLTECDGVGPSKLWYHPSIFQYLYLWVMHGRR